MGFVSYWMDLNTYARFGVLDVPKTAYEVRQTQQSPGVRLCPQASRPDTVRST